MSERMVKKVEKRQIDAARKLFDKMPGWQYAVKTLEKINKEYPGFGDVECFIKTVAVNGLYSTNLYDVGLMALHVTEVFKTIDHKAIASRHDLDLVNKISKLDYPDGKIKWYISFASKFCHFFINNDFPILDTYAIAALKHHDESFRDNAKDKRYPAFVCSIEKVRELSECTIRKLDYYLWLKGMLMVFDGNPEAKLSREFKNIAAGNDDDIQTLRFEK
jgi:hypothetical protein